MKQCSRPTISCGYNVWVDRQSDVVGTPEAVRLSVRPFIEHGWPAVTAFALTSLADPSLSQKGSPEVPLVEWPALHCFIDFLNLGQGEAGGEQSEREGLAVDLLGEGSSGGVDDVLVVKGQTRQL